MPNRLADASSPYLLQHADNPVEWWEWGPDALAAAVTRDVPIFLSVGYSACHWCHVMAHESFEDATTAAYMNEHFVNIKVDREERPDIDRIYMDAVQAMTGQGGWPMSVFLKPNGEPILGGTYYPPEDMGPRPSFRRVMEAVSHAWAERRDEVDDQANQLTSAINRTIPPLDKPPSPVTVDAAVDALLANVDHRYGGFGGAPKFPQAPSLELLLRRLALSTDDERSETIRAALTITLDRMAAGGIYDHLGGGFARYTVDQTWLVPHFEKMLYDNALLARVYLRAWQLLGADGYRAIAEHTLDYLLRDMTDTGGAFHAAEDADSEGEEGKFYVWAASEFEDLLGEDAAVMAQIYGVTGPGNFEGANILQLARPLPEVATALGLPLDRLEAVKQRGDANLLRARSERTRPGRDDKVITAWNGLAIRALAEAGAVLGSEQYLEAARRAARFCLEAHVTSDGRLLRSTRHGRGYVPGFCDDYAALSGALITLFEATSETGWLDAARRLADDMIELFADPDDPGFFASGGDAEGLISRPKNFMDNPTPADNSLAAETLQRLYALTGEKRLRGHVDGVYAAAGKLMAEYPSAVGHLLAVHAVDPPAEVAIIGDPAARAPLTDVIWETYRPDMVLAAGEDDSVPLLAGRTAGESGARAYVCENFVCALPVETPEELREQLERSRESRVASRE